MDTDLHSLFVNSVIHTFRLFDHISEKLSSSALDRYDLSKNDIRRNVQDDATLSQLYLF